MDAVDSDDDVGSVALSHASTVCSALLPVIIFGLVNCKMCRAACNDRSPITNAAPRDQWGGYRPWGHYSKVRDDTGEACSRKPDCKLCLLCINVFNALGRALSSCPGSFSRVPTPIFRHGRLAACCMIALLGLRPGVQLLLYCVFVCLV